MSVMSILIVLSTIVIIGTVVVFSALKSRGRIIFIACLLSFSLVSVGAKNLWKTQVFREIAYKEPRQLTTGSLNPWNKHLSMSGLTATWRHRGFSRYLSGFQIWPGQIIEVRSSDGELLLDIYGDKCDCNVRVYGRVPRHVEQELIESSRQAEDPMGLFGGLSGYLEVVRMGTSGGS